MNFDDLFHLCKVKIRVIWTVLSHFDNDSLDLVGFIASARSSSQLIKFRFYKQVHPNIPRGTLVDKNAKVTNQNGTIFSLHQAST